MNGSKWLRAMLVSLCVLTVVACDDSLVTPDAVVEGEPAAEDEQAAEEEEEATTEEIGETATPDADDGRVPVAILVVDDFTVDDLADDYPEEGENKACPVDADGQSFSARGASFSARGAGADLVDLSDAVGAPLSHGNLVFGKFLQLIEGPVGPPIGSGTGTYPDWFVNVLEWELYGTTLLLVAVDTADFTTEVIAERIPQAIATLREEDGVERFVVNMSFALVPCQPLDEAEYQRVLESELSEYEEALTALFLETFDEPPTEEEVAAFLRPQGLFRTSYRTESVEEQQQQELYVVEAFSAILEEDPLIQLLTNPNEHDEIDGALVISVAAAGNAGLAYSFAPAFEEGVLSVSADAQYANRGEVVAHDVVEVARQGGNGTIEVLGTSFSAPELSVLSAKYLMHGGDAECTEAGVTTKPPLAHEPVTDSWSNLEVSAARSQFCPAFPVAFP